MARDLSLWLRWETEAAERGCVDAQFALGCAYADGSMGVEVNLEVSTEWFRRAALQGHVQSTFIVGVAFEAGKGVEVNFASAADTPQRRAAWGGAGSPSRRPAVPRSHRTRKCGGVVVLGRDDF